MEVPPHLKGYEDLHRKDPQAAARKWFKDAKFGLFIHFGLYSLLGRGEWVMFDERIPVKEYEKLKLKFTAEKFDAERIADLALEAGMKYVNITSKHHDGFCLFRTRETDFNSVESAARRDLIAELASACQRRGLGLFLYYSYACDWRHPYFYPPEAGWRCARPHYERPEPSYLWRRDEDFRHYVEFVHNQLRELLTQYGPIAGIWLDPIMGYYARPDLFPIDETYRLIRSLQPHCLISFKEGANGEEDFAAPERGLRFERMRKHILREFGPKSLEIAERAWERNRRKHIEICDTLQVGNGIKGHLWGYNAKARHRSVEEVLGLIENARKLGANLLLNIGPLGDGSIHPEDEAVLRELAPLRPRL